MAKNWVSATMSTDLKNYEAFRCCNTLNQKMMNDMGMSNKRINNHFKDKLIEKVDLFNKKNGTSSTIYKPTNKGKNFMANKLNVENKNWYSSGSDRHDIGVAKVYVNLTETQKVNCITELDVREKMRDYIHNLKEQGEQRMGEGYAGVNNYIDRANELEERLNDHSISPPDLVYIENGQMVSIEITTDAYSILMIDAKEDFCEELGIKFETYRI